MGVRQDGSEFQDEPWDFEVKVANGLFTVRARGPRMEVLKGEALVQVTTENADRLYVYHLAKELQEARTNAATPS